MDQIVQIHMHGQVLMYPYRDGFHQRQMVENDAIALAILVFCRAGVFLIFAIMWNCLTVTVAP